MVESLNEHYKQFFRKYSEWFPDVYPVNPYKPPYYPKTIYKLEDIISMPDKQPERFYTNLHFTGVNKVFNVIKIDDNTQRLEIALAGYEKQNIDIYTEQNCLFVVTNRKNTNSNEFEYLQKSFSTSDFSFKFDLNRDWIVQKASYENGVLSVTLNKVLPEEQKRKDYNL